MRSISVRRLVRLLGAIVALVVPTLIPIGYGLIGYFKEAEALAFKAEVSSNRAAQYIYASGELWQYKALGLGTAIELPGIGTECVVQRIFDANGRLVLLKGEPLASPTLTRSMPIVVAGAIVGRIEVEESFRPLLAEVGLVALATIAVGFGAYFAFAVFPLRVLNRTLGELETSNKRYETLNKQLLDQTLCFDAALEHMSQGIIMFDSELRIVVSNDRYAEIYGLTPEQVVPGTTLRQLIEHRIANGHIRGKTADELLKSILSHVPHGKAEGHYISRLSDGRHVAVAVRSMANGGTVSTHQDITERQRLNAELERNHRLLGERTSLLQAIVDNFPGGIGFFDRDLRLVVCNERAKVLLDLPDCLFANGPATLTDLLRFNANRGEFGPGDIEEQVATRLALATDRKPYHFERERPSGTALDVRGVPLDGGGFLTTYMDITERRRSEAKIARMARHDALTGLPNRVLLNEQLDLAVARVRRGEIIATHLLDLDRFKIVNDTLGHPAGDKLLQMVADRLRPLVRETDTIARMRGDEFAILQVAIMRPSDVTSLAQRVIEAVSEPYEIDLQQVVIGTSVGIAMGPSDGLNPDELIKNADLALYRAKGDGRGTFCFFEREMDAQMQARRAMEEDLRKALIAGEFELYYQPAVNLGSKAISSFEALVRWHHPVNGTVPPDEFMPLAEEIGLIVPLGEWVLRNACATAAKWPDHIKVSVNISRGQFRNPGLQQIVVGALELSGLPPERLELEITEGTLLQDSETALSTLYELRALGVRIAMDDFGTGYSSLSYLQSFPFDKIKIDRSFVKDITDGVGSLNIVRAVAAMAKGLGMETTAEGVETNEQHDTVTAEGCTEMQGSLFSQPLPAHEIARLFVSSRKERTQESTASAA